MIGEIEFFTSNPMAATVIAKEDLEILKIKKSDLKQFIAYHSGLGLRIYELFTIDIIEKLKEVTEKCIKLENSVRK
jgi:CRP-like cAMP-binding protein